MNTGLYLAFIVASTLLILTPGPTALLIVSTSLRRGRGAGLVAVAGSTMAAGCQLIAVVAGLASVVTLVSSGFVWLRWLGVAYLVYLGVSAWFGTSAGANDDLVALRREAGAHHFGRGFLVTLTNPKTMLFHGAFLPQFVDPTLPRLPQLAILALSFLVVAGIGDSAWAIAAAKVGRSLSSRRAKRLTGRVSGSILIGAAVLLAAVRRQS